LKAKSQENLSEDEQSIFQKLVKVDRKVAMIMAGDLVAGGVDTVNTLRVRLMEKIIKIRKISDFCSSVRYPLLLGQESRKAG
jgi:hypothetical protein